MSTPFFSFSPSPFLFFFFFLFLFPRVHALSRAYVSRFACRGVEDLDEPAEERNRLEKKTGGKKTESRGGGKRKADSCSLAPRPLHPHHL